MRDKKKHGPTTLLVRVWLENLFSTRRIDMEAAPACMRKLTRTRLLRVAAQRKLLLTRFDQVL